jgi:hypothetical protein
MKTKCVVVILLSLMACSAIPALGYDQNTCIKFLEEKGLAGPDTVCLPGTFTNSPAVHRYCVQQRYLYAPVQGMQCVNKQTRERALVRMEHAQTDMSACQMKGPDWTIKQCYSCCGGEAQ